MILDFDTARTWYPQGDPVHGFDHILRVYRLAERLAISEGADLEIVRTAALLHDARGGQSGDLAQSGERLGHHLASAEFAAEILQAQGWTEARISAVQHCIRAHRFRDDSEQPASLEAQVLFDADKLDAIGAVGVARAIAFAVQARQPAYARPSERFLQNGQLQPGEPHSAYHEFIYKLQMLKARMYTSSGRRLAEQRHRFMEDYFQRLAAETSGEA
jgi:uncharacterized protein